MKNLEVLKSRYNSAVEAVSKIEGTLSKWQQKFAKRRPEFDSMASREYIEKFGFEEFCKIDNAKDYILENSKKLENAKDKVEQLKAEMEQVQDQQEEIPAILINLMNELISYYNNWDENDEATMKKYTIWYGKKGAIERIHKDNEKFCRGIIKDLVLRCKKKVGKITSYKNLYVQNGSYGIPALNGKVLGENGEAEVESIVAGGYNIQRKHIRVLVK